MYLSLPVLIFWRGRFWSVCSRAEWFGEVFQTARQAVCFAASLAAFLALAFSLFLLFLGLLFGRFLPTKPCFLLKCLLLIFFDFKLIAGLL